MDGGGGKQRPGAVAGADAAGFASTAVSATGASLRWQPTVAISAMPAQVTINRRESSVGEVVMRVTWQTGSA